MHFVGDKHVATGCDTGLFPTSPITISERASIPASLPPQLRHPLVAHTWAGRKWSHDTTMLLKLVTLGKAGIASIDAFAALFLAWAHHQTLLSSARTHWPARTKAHTLKWARSQVWVRPGCGIGANGELCLSRAEQGKHINAAELLRTATPAAKLFFVNALGAPASYIVSLLPGASATHFVAPELWLQDGLALPYAQLPPKDPRVIIPTAPNRHKGLGALGKCCKDGRATLLSLGTFKVEAPIKYCRATKFISVHGHPAGAPFAYIHIGSAAHIVWTRAAHVVAAITQRSVNLVLYPSVYSDQRAQKKNVSGAVMYSAECITWGELHNIIYEHGLDTVALCGHTPAAIQGGFGPTWLSLLAMPETTIDLTGLTPCDTEPVSHCQLNAAIKEDMLTQANKGSLHAIDHAKIYSPAPMHADATITILRAAATILAPG